MNKGKDWEDIKGNVSERSHHWLKVAFTGSLRSAPMSRPEEKISIPARRYPLSTADPSAQSENYFTTN